VGGVRTALFNYLFARHHGGEFLLRIEDTDQKRYVPGAEAYIMEALAWCGISPDYSPQTGGPDAPYRQSERKPMYRAYAEQLIAAGHAYYAFDTEEELEAMRENAEKAGMKNWQYNAITRQNMRNSLTLPADEVQRLLDSGANYVVRMQIPRNEEIRFEDAIRGWVLFQTNQLDDKVLMKQDGMPTYHLANVVDDHTMRISHVIRGEEWLPSAPLHVYMYRCFGWEAPVFAHLPLLLSPDGKGKLSKRDGDKHGFPIFPLDWHNAETGETAKGYREAGYLPDAFVNFLALLGWNPGNDQELLTREEMVRLFSLERVGKSGVKFDKAKSVWFNATYLRAMTPTELLPHLKAQLAAANIPHTRDDAFLLEVLPLIQERADYLTDLAPLAAPYLVAPESFDSELVAKRWNPQAAEFIAGLLPQLETFEPWAEAPLEAFVKGQVEAAGLGLGKVMPPLRLALTNRMQGAELFRIFELLGRQETLARLQAALRMLA
jgi:glutamyl-tRNA synthetase